MSNVSRECQWYVMPETLVFIAASRHHNLCNIMTSRQVPFLEVNFAIDSYRDRVLLSTLSSLGAKGLSQTPVKFASQNLAM